MKLFIAIIVLIALILLAVLIARFAGKKPIKVIKIVIAAVLELALLLGIIASLITVKNLADSKIWGISGEWECAEFLVEDEETYTGFLCMDISPTGSFSMYDGEAGNPAIDGILLRVGSDRLLMVCTNYADFDPPPGWEDMGKFQTFEFEIKDSKLFLKYENSTLEFEKYE